MECRRCWWKWSTRTYMHTKISLLVSPLGDIINSKSTDWQHKTMWMRVENGNEEMKIRAIHSIFVYNHFHYRWFCMRYTLLCIKNIWFFSSVYCFMVIDVRGYTTILLQQQKNIGAKLLCVLFSVQEKRKKNNKICNVFHSVTEIAY